MAQQSVKLGRDEEQKVQLSGPQAWLSTTLGRLLVSLFVPLVTFVVLWQVFLFLHDAQIPLWITALLAIVWGVGGVLVLFSISNYVIEQLPNVWRRRLTPFVFIGPALAILTWYLVLPTSRSLITSFYDTNGRRTTAGWCAAVVCRLSSRTHFGFPEGCTHTGGAEGCLH